MTGINKPINFRRKGIWRKGKGNNKNPKRPDLLRFWTPGKLFIKGYNHERFCKSIINAPSGNGRNPDFYFFSRFAGNLRYGDPRNNHCGSHYSPGHPIYKAPSMKLKQATSLQDDQPFIRRKENLCRKNSQRFCTGR